MLISAKFKGYVIWFIYFLELLWVRYNAKFYHCMICVTNFSDGEPFWTPTPHPHSWAAPKKPILNRVKDFFVSAWSIIVIYQPQILLWLCCRKCSWKRFWLRAWFVSICSFRKLWCLLLKLLSLAQNFVSALPFIFIS